MAGATKASRPQQNTMAWDTISAWLDLAIRRRCKRFGADVVGVGRGIALYHGKSPTTCRRPTVLRGCHNRCEEGRGGSGRVTTAMPRVTVW